MESRNRLTDRERKLVVIKEEIKGVIRKLFVIRRMEKAMATHSSTLAWQIPWMEEPGRLQSMGSLRVRHD